MTEAGHRTYGPFNLERGKLRDFERTALPMIGNPSSRKQPAEKKGSKLLEAFRHPFLREVRASQCEQISPNFRLIELEGPALRSANWTPGQHIQIFCQTVLKTLAIDNFVLIERSDFNSHLRDVVGELIRDAMSPSYLALTGNAVSIQMVRKQLSDAERRLFDITVKPYWAQGKRGLD